jgi:hypothetical protein
MAMRKATEALLREIFGEKAQIEMRDPRYGSGDTNLHLMVNGVREGQMSFTGDETCCGADIVTAPWVRESSPKRRARIFQALFMLAQDLYMHRLPEFKDDDDEDRFPRGVLYYTTPDETIKEGALAAKWRQVTHFFNPNSGNNVYFLMKRLHAPRDSAHNATQ